MPEEAPVTSATPLVPVLLISALLRVRESASFSRFSAVRSRASQIGGLPARSANSRYHAASSRNFSSHPCEASSICRSGCSTALGLGSLTGRFQRFAPPHKVIEHGLPALRQIGVVVQG